MQEAMPTFAASAMLPVNFVNPVGGKISSKTQNAIIAAFN
jgi:hypothetical protein